MINLFEFANEVRRINEAQFKRDLFDVFASAENTGSLVKPHFVQPFLRCSPEPCPKIPFKLAMRNLAEPRQFTRTIASNSSK